MVWSRHRISRHALPQDLHRLASPPIERLGVECAPLSASRRVRPAAALGGQFNGAESAVGNCARMGCPSFKRSDGTGRCVVRRLDYTVLPAGEGARAVLYLVRRLAPLMGAGDA